MVGTLPALFGRVFLIGYLIPAAAICMAGAAVLDFYGFTHLYAAAKPLVDSTDEKTLALRIGVFVAFIWVLAVLLMASNLAIIRLLEGYGPVNPARLIKWRTVFVFNDLIRERDDIDALRQELGQAGKAVSARLEARERKIVVQLGNEFPEREDLVLPTRFGNVIRAFERYPQVVYGIDAIQAWGRLQAVLSAGYCTLLDEAKAQLDLLVNLWFGGVLIAALHLGLFAWTSRHLDLAAWGSSFKGGFIPVMAVVVAIVAAKWAQSAAGQWGVLVKGAFDLYRGDLSRQMGLEMPRSIVHERKMWTTVAQTMLYRLPHFADALTQYRSFDPPQGKRDDKKA